MIKFLVSLLVVLVPWPSRASNRSIGEDLFAIFFQWLQVGIEEAGLASISAPVPRTFEVREGRFGLSLHSKLKFSPGSTLVALPMSRLITSNDYWGSVPLGFDLSEDALDPAKVQSFMAAYIAKERKAGSRSKWAPYINVLSNNHDFLPKYWDAEVMSTHLKGSHFPAFVRNQRNLVKSTFEGFESSAALSWLEYEWGWDVTTTRVMDLGSSGKKAGLKDSLSFFPLLDIALHGDRQNVKCIFDRKLEALRVIATQHIAAGGEVFNGYIKDGSHTNWNLLQNWGFAMERAGATRGHVQLHIDPAIPEAKMTKQKRRLLLEAHDMPLDAKDMPHAVFALSEHGDDSTAYSLIGYLRFLTDDHFWDDADVEKIPAWPPTTWKQEHKALHLGLKLIREALRAYPESRKDDKALLAKSKNLDALQYFMIILRLGEKETLWWWHDFLGKAIEQNSDADDSPVDIKYIKRLWNERKKSFSMLHHLNQDVSDIMGTPFEFASVVFGLFIILDVAAYVVTFLVRSTWYSVVYRWWKQMFGFLAVLLALSRFESILFVFSGKMNLVVLIASAMHVLVRRVRLKITEPDRRAELKKLERKKADVSSSSHKKPS